MRCAKAILSVCANILPFGAALQTVSIICQPETSGIHAMQRYQNKTNSCGKKGKWCGCAPTWLFLASPEFNLGNPIPLPSLKKGLPVSAAFCDRANQLPSSSSSSSPFVVVRAIQFHPIYRYDTAILRQRRRRWSQRLFYTALQM